MGQKESKLNGNYESEAQKKANNLRTAIRVSKPKKTDKSSSSSSFSPTTATKLKPTSSSSKPVIKKVRNTEKIKVRERPKVTPRDRPKATVIERSSSKKKVVQVKQEKRDNDEYYDYGHFDDDNNDYYDEVFEEYTAPPKRVRKASKKRASPRTPIRIMPDRKTPKKKVIKAPTAMDNDHGFQMPHIAAAVETAITDKQNADKHGYKHIEHGDKHGNGENDKAADKHEKENQIGENADQSNIVHGFETPKLTKKKTSSSKKTSSKEKMKRIHGIKVEVGYHNPYSTPKHVFKKEFVNTPYSQLKHPRQALTDHFFMATPTLESNNTTSSSEENAAPIEFIPSLIEDDIFLVPVLTLSARKRNAPRTPKNNPSRDIAKPKSAFTYFQEDVLPSLQKRHPNKSMLDVASRVGRKWLAVSDEKKKLYATKESADKERYRMELETVGRKPFRPRQNKIGKKKSLKKTKKKKIKDESCSSAEETDDEEYYTQEFDAYEQELKTTTDAVAI